MLRVMRSLRAAGAVFVAAVVVLALAPTAMAEVVRSAKLPNGAKRIEYRIGPFDVIPGQNEIGLRSIRDKPEVDGWITRIRPDLTYLDGRVPGVDVIHLHHGVWLNLARRDATWPGIPERFFASGEEKTIFSIPRPYAYQYKASDGWLLNHMIHNLTPVATKVYMTYEIDFIPADSRAARGLRPARPIWMDVVNKSIYPVFNVGKGSGSKGTFTFPDDQPDAYRPGNQRNEWEVDRNGVLIATAGHLHPGGLHNDLWLRREGARVREANCGRFRSTSVSRACRRNAPRGSGDTAHLFRSHAKYHEPAGAVSWDVSMTATKDRWRVKVRKGDVLRTSVTYNTRRGSWWESMGIMVAWMADGGPGKNPFKRRVGYPVEVTHGHLPENDNHGGKRTRLPDPRKLASGAANPGSVDILGFNYQLGDLRVPGSTRLPPVIAPGQALEFRNADVGNRVYHSISSCKAPCNRSTGVAYPIADGPVQFESGTLGDDRPVTTGQISWRTPNNLDPGTYTYFCRIHPFMRGAFRVQG
jgi:plastocyanin